jgi:hypothetical protein
MISGGRQAAEVLGRIGDKRVLALLKAFLKAGVLTEDGRDRETITYLWTFAALRLSTGARAHYDRRRVAGDRHTAAQRHLFNRFLGCLDYCLQTGQTYAELQAFPVAQSIAA